jgi:hypothetical protein
MEFTGVVDGETVVVGVTVAVDVGVAVVDTGVVEGGAVTDGVVDVLPLLQAEISETRVSITTRSINSRFNILSIL